MRVLITGTRGLLGSNIVSVALNHGYQVIGSYHTEKPPFDVPLYKFDLRDDTRFTELLNKTEPDIVINCAARTDVDDCEKDPERAYAINAEAPGILASLCREAQIQFVQISTDYVFDGTNKTPYSEDDEPNPVQVYGASKREGELAALETYEQSIIVRISFVYGRNQATDELAGFPAWIVGKINTSEEIPLFTDKQITPTHAAQAAQTILELTEMETDGIYHATSKSCVTPYNFGLTIAEHTDIEDDVFTSTTLDATHRPATRPKYTCLSAEKIERKLKRPQPTLPQDLINTGLNNSIDDLVDQ